MGKPEDITTLVRSCQDGVDPEEHFRRIFQAFAPKVRRFFERRGCGREQSRDLTQETFIRVFKGLKSYRGDVEFSVWLYQVARNVLSNARRDACAQKRGGERGANLSVESVDALEDGREEPLTLQLHSDLLHDFLMKHRLAEVREAIAALPAQMRRCLVLRAYQDRSYEEIATILQLSVDTVKSHLLQARRRLRAAMDRREAEMRQPRDAGDAV